MAQVVNSPTFMWNNASYVPFYDNSTTPSIGTTTLFYSPGNHKFSVNSGTTPQATADFKTSIGITGETQDCFDYEYTGSLIPNNINIFN